MPQSRPTIYDVARAAGVSKSLVSLVLRGSDRVSPARRQAVEKAIAELEYRPSQAATSLASARSRSIGLVIDDFENLWFVHLLRGIRKVLGDTGFHISVADRDLNGHLRQDPLDGFLSRAVEGLIVAAELGGQRLGDLDVPVVVVGGRARVPRHLDLVANDDRSGAAQATRHLLDLGHRRIAHVTGEGGAAALRRSSYAAVMSGAGLEPLVAGGRAPTTERSGYDETTALLAECPDTTAVFAANDTMALGVVAALRDCGRRVPEDVSVVGYDNSPLASARLLQLTTVDDRSEDVGAAAARALLARIAHPGRARERALLEPVLVRRGSTAEPC